ncbi:thioredoxin family protein [Paracoccus luteus]|uniref:thioredoxin family protein n=1 Tax=Paracoccus luteus TaxID=2508543 RepID=UPI001FE654F5|nr:thioredoxin family protein [Paracoccus luteus]
MTMTRILGAALAAVLTLIPLAPRADVPLGDDGLHKPAWLKTSFKDLPEDLAEATAARRTLLVIVEQRGCIYCAQMHEQVFTDPRVEALIRDHFDVVQVDLFGATDVTDLDGEVLSEKRMAGRWGVTVTPTMLLLPADPEPGVGAARAAMAVIPGPLVADQTAALFDWARQGGPATGRTLAQVLKPPG